MRQAGGAHRLVRLANAEQGVPLSVGDSCTSTGKCGRPLACNCCHLRTFVTSQSMPPVDVMPCTTGGKPCQRHSCTEAAL